MRKAFQTRFSPHERLDQYQTNRFSPNQGPMSLPPAQELPKLSFQENSKALGLLFEPCDSLVELAWPLIKESSGSTWPQLIEQIRLKLLSLPHADPKVSKIVAAHPRLGAQKIDSSHSVDEQASLGVSSANEASELKRLNDLYESTFPGLRYVVFVAGRPRSKIIEDMEKRVSENNYDAEIEKAFNAMCDIALDREQKARNV